MNVQRFNCSCQRATIVHMQIFIILIIDTGRRCEYKLTQTHRRERRAVVCVRTYTHQNNWICLKCSSNQINRTWCRRRRSHVRTRCLCVRACVLFVEWSGAERLCAQCVRIRRPFGHIAVRCSDFVSPPLKFAHSGAGVLLNVYARSLAESTSTVCTYGARDTALDLSANIHAGRCRRRRRHRSNDDERRQRCAARRSTLSGAHTCTRCVRAYPHTCSSDSDWKSFTSLAFVRRPNSVTRDISIICEIC